MQVRYLDGKIILGPPSPDIVRLFKVFSHIPRLLCFTQVAVTYTCTSRGDIVNWKSSGNKKNSVTFSWPFAASVAFVFEGRALCNPAAPMRPTLEYHPPTVLTQDRV